MIKLCEECPDYSTCKKLCPEAEAYVNQDYVKLKEELFNDITTTPIEEYDIPPIEYSIIDYQVIKKLQDMYSFSDKIFDILFYYYVEGKTQEQVSEIVQVSQPYVCKIISKYK